MPEHAQGMIVLAAQAEQNCFGVNLDILKPIYTDDPPDAFLFANGTLNVALLLIANQGQRLKRGRMQRSEIGRRPLKGDISSALLGHTSSLKAIVCFDS